MRWCLSALVEVSLLLLWRVTPSASGILDRTCGVWELSMSMVLRHVEVSRFVCMCDWLLFFQRCLCGRLRTESMGGHSSCSGYKHWPLTTLNMHWTDKTEMDRWMVAVSMFWIYLLVHQNNRNLKRWAREKSHPTTALIVPMAPVNVMVVTCRSERVRGKWGLHGSSSPYWLIGDQMQRLPASVKIVHTFSY